MIVNRDSFIASTDNAEDGTVEITLRGTTRRVRASRSPEYGWVFAYGIVGRYQTGGKLWPASVQSNADGMEFVNFGRDDRNPKFRKEQNIWFAD